MPIYNFNNPEEKRAYEKTLPRERWNLGDDKQALKYALLLDTREERVALARDIKEAHGAAAASRLVASLKAHAESGGKAA